MGQARHDVAARQLDAGQARQRLDGQVRLPDLPPDRRRGVPPVGGLVQATQAQIPMPQRHHGVRLTARLSLRPDQGQRLLAKLQRTAVVALEGRDESEMAPGVDGVASIAAGKSSSTSMK